MVDANSVDYIGPKRRTQEAKNKSHYNLYKWVNPGLERNLGHITIIAEDDQRILIEQQPTRGVCILCSNVFSASKPYLMRRHYRVKHHKTAIVLDHMKHLRCKCNNANNMGTDKANRNMHYHCLHCKRPSMHRSQYADHLISRHDYELETVAHLYE